MTLHRPEAVLFDWDNTLVDTWPVIHQALRETFTIMGHTPWTLEEVKQRVQHSARDAFPKLFGDDWKRAADIYRDAYRSKNLANLTPLPQAEDVLKLLHSEGIYLAIVSNKMGDTLRKEVAHLGWNKYFRALVGATDTPHDKPDPTPVYRAMEPGNLNASSNIWFIGDSVVDIEVAERAGITPLLYGEIIPDDERPNYYGGFPYYRHYCHHSEFLSELKQLLT